MLAAAGAKELDPSAGREELELDNIVNELCLAANMPKPKVYTIDDTALNAFATGRDPQHASIAVTTGLMARLDREEMSGVIAHELSISARTVEAYRSKLLIKLNARSTTDLVRMAIKAGLDQRPA